MKEDKLIELEKLRHKNSLEQLQFIRSTEKCKHQWELERMRIKNAEIRRHYERKARFETAKSL